MKKLTYIITALLALLTVAACSEREWPNTLPTDQQTEGEGSIEVQLRGSATRATTSTITKEEANLFLVTITKGDELVAQQTQLGNVGHMTFPAGYGYKLFVESITESQAETLNDGWGAKRFTGNSKSFGIQAGQTTAVAVNCTVANAAVAVNLEAEGCTVIVSDGTRSLTTTEDRIAYFNIPQTGKLDVTLTIQKDGETIKEEPLTLEPAQVKDVNIVDKEPESETGTLGITITYDDHFEVVETEINVE